MKSKKGVVVSQAVVIIFTIITATVIIVIAARGIGLFSNTGKEYQNTKLIQAFNNEFDSIKKLGYGSRIKTEIPSYGAYMVCFVDLDIILDSEISVDLPPELSDFVTADGQNADIYIFGDKIDMIDVGNISVSSEDNQVYLCINSTNYFQFYLTNNGTSVIVSRT